MAVLENYCSGSIIVWLHWSQNRYDKTVWADGREGSKNQPLYCSWQLQHCNQCDWHVFSQQFLTLRPNRIGLFQANSLVRHLQQLAYDWSVGEMDKTYLIELVWDILHLWDQRDKKYHKRGFKPKTLVQNRKEIKLYW
jgi:hypothetical protein